MRRITYGGGVFLTGDDIASALLAYAHALSETKSADTVMVPGMTTDSVKGHIEVLIGPASQLMSEPAPEGSERTGDISDENFIDDLLEREAHKRAGGPTTLDVGSASWIDDV